MLLKPDLRRAAKGRVFAAAILIGLITLTASALPIARHNGKKRGARQVVEALEQQWRQAQLTGDVAAMDRLLSDDFVGITAFGDVTTKAQQLARVRDRVVLLTRLDLSDIKVKLIGPSAAVVTSRAEVTGTGEGRAITGAFRYTRVYQRLANGVWKITSFEATRMPSDHSSRVRSEADAARATNP